MRAAGSRVYEYDVPWPEQTASATCTPSTPTRTHSSSSTATSASYAPAACAPAPRSRTGTCGTWRIVGSAQAGGGRGPEPARRARRKRGQCVAYCPVGALYDKMSLAEGRASQITKVRTTCSYCGVGCNFDLNVRNGKIVRVHHRARCAGQRDGDVRQGPLRL